MSDLPPPFLGKQSVMSLLTKLRPAQHHPFSAMIEISDRCNEACIHCYQVHGQKGELSTEEWKTIVDELAELGVFILTISGGEATLRKDLFEIIEHARKRSFAIKLYTNGLTVTEETAARLAELAVMEVQISLYSHDPAVHDAVTRVPGSFERSIAAARHLRRHGLAVVLKTPVMAMNADGMDRYIALVKDVGADYQFDPHLDPREDGDATPEQYRLDDQAYLRVQRHLAPPGPRGPAVERPLDGHVCGACSGHVHVEANGELRPCTQLQVPVGHALRDGVRAAWEGNEAAKEIRTITWRDLWGCRVCDLRSSCGRCFAVARVEGSDALSPYESACRRARLNYELQVGEPVRVRAGARPDVSVGPYRVASPTELVTIAGDLTEADRKRIARSDWMRPPAALVELRRKTRPEPIPAAAERLK
ncbi:MAG: radical SAM protein [Myxococcales bacterium]|nr:radical SAM protein [Myxococcales bacterium]